MSTPTPITMTPEEVEALCAKISGSNLNSDESKLLIGMFNANAWLQQVLAEGKITIRRLQKLFGVATEQLKNYKAKRNPHPIQ